MSTSGHNTISHHAAETAARDSYGKLMAYLSVRCHDIHAVEDALADAFTEALERWPIQGIPDNPDAWLLTVSRRRLIDQHRQLNTEQHHLEQLSFLLRPEIEATVTATLPDERLKLLFVCAHPAIDQAARAPLMLQAVFGLDAARIASAFIVPAATMGQRLVRSKTRIRELAVPFEIPQQRALPERVGSVLDAIYAVYGTSWDDLADADTVRQGLCDEAIRLGRLLVQLLPSDPEAKGLLALMLYCQARQPARLNASSYVPLLEQDTTRWDHGLIEEAEQLLTSAFTHQDIGRYQLEAAIQSAHSNRTYSGEVDGAAILTLYRALLVCDPSIGAQVSYAAALAEFQGAASALAVLDTLRRNEVEQYQPYWVVLARVQKELGHGVEATEAHKRAIELTHDPLVREFLRRQSRR